MATSLSGLQIICTLSGTSLRAMCTMLTTVDLTSSETLSLVGFLLSIVTLHLHQPSLTEKKLFSNFSDAQSISTSVCRTCPRKSTSSVVARATVALKKPRQTSKGPSNEKPSSQLFTMQFCGSSPNEVHCFDASVHSISLSGAFFLTLSTKHSTGVPQRTVLSLSPLDG